MLATNDDIAPVRGGIAALKKHRHPISEHGIGQDLAVKLLVLDRFLRKQAEEVQDSVLELHREHGEEQIEGDPTSRWVKKGQKGVAAFNLAVQALGRTEFEIPNRMCLRVSELVVRDEDGERVPIEIGEIADLGPVLILEETDAQDDNDGSDAGSNGHKAPNRVRKAARR